MADLLALSWDRRGLSGIEFSPGSAAPRVQNGFRVDWPEQLTASWLKETIRQHGINAKQVLVALPREDAVLRLLELPEVPDAELPTLVRFQAAARSSQPIEQLLLDYLPLPAREGIAQKEVWLATAPLSTIDPIRTLLSEAGFDVTQITLSSLCLTELVARAEARHSLDPLQASLVVLRSGVRMELALLSQRQFIAAHAVKWSSINDIPPIPKMLAEVSRLTVQVQAWLPEGTPKRVWVIGDDPDVPDLIDGMKRRWNCEVKKLNPLEDASLSLGPKRIEGLASEYAIAAGLAMVQVGPLCPKLDLLHPRQPPPKRDPRKPYIAAAAACGLVVVALATAIVQQTLAGYDQEIESLRLEDNKLFQLVKAGDPKAKAAASLSDWQYHNVNQLKQMSELHQVMNGTQRIVIGDYRFSPSFGAVIAKIRLIGNAKDRTDAAELTQNLASMKKYSIRPGSPTDRSPDPDYVSRFDFEMDLIPPNAKSTPPKPGTTPPANPNPAKPL